MKTHILKSTITICLMVFSIGVIKAQSDVEPRYKSYDWNSDPKWSPLEGVDTSESTVILENNTIIEYYYDPEYEGNLVELKTIHKIIRVRTNDALDENNKIYISMYNSLDLLNPKARVIKPNGNVIQFNEENIMEAEEAEDIGGLKYFAIEGAVKESDIEYMYTVKRFPNVDGAKLYFQDDVTMKHQKVIVISPPNLHFKFKSYNGISEFELDSTNEDQNVYKLEVKDIPKLKDEHYSAYRKSLKAVVYKLDYNSVTRKSDLYNFSKVAQSIFENSHYDIGKKATKKLTNLMKDWGVYDANSEEEKVRVLETNLKSAFPVISGAPSKKVIDILDDKFTSDFGITTLFINCLTILDIKYELGLTCDRHSFYFDPEFEHYQVLQEYFIYFPKTKLYMSPSSFVSRLGYLPSELIENHGLFIAKMDLGDGYTGLAKVKKIPAPNYETSVDKMEVEVDLSDILVPIIEFRRTLSGYSSVGIQTYYKDLSEEDRKELDDAFVKFASEDGKVVKYEVTGTDKSDAAVNPLVFTGKIEAPSLIERAGNKYVVKVGELIGAQAEMYKDEERTTDVENEFNRTYSRTIVIQIPEGYKVGDLESLNINEVFPEENPTSVFKSTYKVEGNTITIDVIEYYNQIKYTKDEFEGFRRIINAAANFNKLVIVLEK